MVGPSRPLTCNCVAAFPGPRHVQRGAGKTSRGQFRRMFYAGAAFFTVTLDSGNGQGLCIEPSGEDKLGGAFF